MNNEELLHALGNLLLNNNKSITLDLAFENFISNAKCRCRTESINYYNKTWKTLKETLKDLNLYNTSDINKVSYNQIIKVMMNKGYSVNYINKFMDLLKMVMKINVDLEYISFNPIAGIKKLKETLPQIQTITKENVELILNYLFSLKPTFTSVRNTLFILLMNDTGIRANELIHVKIKNIHIDSNAIFLDYTKTHEPRWIFFQDITKHYLIEYLKFHNGNEYLLLDSDGKHMKKKNIYDTLDFIKAKLNIEQSITPHKWRHTFATNLIKNNVNLNTIMKVMGHTQYSTTKRYLHQETDELKEQVLKVISIK